VRANPFGAILLKSPYASIKLAFKSHATSAASKIVRDTFNSEAAISEVNAPILLIHG
jgi:predicted peptidase